jgi:hypothetical protein
MRSVRVLLAAGACGVRVLPYALRNFLGHCTELPMCQSVPLLLCFVWVASTVNVCDQVHVGVHGSWADCIQPIR